MYRILTNPTVKNKLLFLGLTLLLLVSLLVLSGWHGFKLVQQKARIASTVEIEAAYLQAIMRGLAEVALTEGTPAPRKLTREAVEDFDATLQKLTAVVRSEEILHRLVSNIQPRWAPLKVQVRAFLALEEVSPYDVSSMIEYGRLSIEGDKLLQDLSEIVELEHDYANSTVTDTLRVIGLFAIVILLITGLLLLNVYRSVAQPIARMAQLAQQAAEGDLTQNFNLDRQDEIGILAESFGSMTESLKTVISRVKTLSAGMKEASQVVSESSSEVLNAAAFQKKAVEGTAKTIHAMDGFILSMSQGAGHLFDSAGISSSTIEEMTFSIRDVASQAVDFQQMQDDAASSVAEMITSVEAVDGSIQMLSQVSEQTVHSLGEVETSIHQVEQKALESVALAEQVSKEASVQGMPAIQAAVAGIEDIKRSVGSLAEVVYGLGKRSEQIGRLLSVIDEVADQTQLLSLNAAIIAAQSGEQGRAFSVVAEEIKAFAQKTSVSTKEVAELIAAIQGETRSSVTMVEEGMSAVEKGLHLVQGASTAFESIQSNSLLSTDMSKAIQQTTTMQAKSIYQVTKAIKEMAGFIDQITRATKDQTAGNRVILESVDKTRYISQQVVSAMEEQAEGGKLISQVSSEVADQAEQIKKDIENHKLRSGEVVEAIGGINQRNQDLVASASTVTRSLKSLNQAVKGLEEELSRFQV